MRVSLGALLAVVCAASVSAQSLGDVARKEKKRREKNERSGATVRVITDADVRRGPEVVSRPASGSEEDPGDLASRPAPAASTGDLAPDFTLPDRSGRSYSLADFRGRPLVLDFWATWCGPCRQTMPEIEQLHRRYRGQLQVVGINIEGSSPDVLSYVDQGGYTFQVLFDSGNWDATAATRYGVDSIPRTFLVDRNGRILYEGMPRGLTDEQIQAALATR